MPSYKDFILKAFEVIQKESGGKFREILDEGEDINNTLIAEAELAKDKTKLAELGIKI